MSDKSKRAPINTEALARQYPSMQAWVMGGNPAAIESQEAGGQGLFINSDTLPTQMPPEDRTALETAGVKFLGQVENDPLFQYVELPEDWKRVPTDHSMWSKLVDNKGRERAAMFYKAAFYDRSAHLRTSLRYGVRLDYERIDKEGVAVARVFDCGTVIHETEPIAIDGQKQWEVNDAATKLACAWLDSHFPDWRNPAAYWD